MLDIRKIRDNTEEITELLQRKGDYSVDALLEMDKKRRELITEVEEKKARQNKVSKMIPVYKKEKKDVSEILKEMKGLSEEIKQMDESLREIDASVLQALLELPNTPHPDVVIGKDDSENRLVRTWGTPREFSFEIKAHWDIGTDLDILDFDRAAKITGARFSLFKGLGAKLERAIINFMLSVHTEEGSYVELSTPFMVNRDCMTGTGQFPKFEDDAYRVLENRDLFLIPTAEVPVTNYHREEILDEDQLPIYYTAYSPCFRKEAGSAGRDTRGLIRNHQFDKVEIVKFSKPETSYEEHESLTNDAEKILQILGLPYRVVELCTGDMTFSSAKTYDLEVWMPSYGRYVEISSCSNFEDYQARRANIRYRDKETGKNHFVHTLNGSGLAVGRTFAAILENYQNEDGSVTIPEALRGFINGLEEIK